MGNSDPIKKFLSSVEGKLHEWIPQCVENAVVSASNHCTLSCLFFLKCIKVCCNANLAVLLFVFSSRISRLVPCLVLYINPFLIGKDVKFTQEWNCIPHHYTVLIKSIISTSLPKKIPDARILWEFTSLIHRTITKLFLPQWEMLTAGSLKFLQCQLIKKNNSFCLLNKNAATQPEDVKALILFFSTFALFFNFLLSWKKILFWDK